jgi:hypothetical protein
MESGEQYGERYESLVILFTSGLIVACILGAIALQQFRPDCRDSDYTFCGTGMDSSEAVH